MAGKHTFCRTSLVEARREAGTRKVKIPTYMRAVKAYKMFVVEAKGMKRQTVQACCACAAKAKVIGDIVKNAK
jgi:hypothetical protein